MAVDKNKALDAALSQIERAFGKGSIMRMGAKQTLDGEIEVKALDAVAGHMKALGRRLQACT